MTALSAVPGAPAPARPTVTVDPRRLRRELGANAILPGDPAYELARYAHNTLFDRRPAAIVRPTGSREVARAILGARELGLDIAIRGGGHSVAGHSTTDGGVLIDLAYLRQVDIDPVVGIGTAQGGATAGEYMAASAEHGLATPFGDAASVGLGGLTLGGGVGWLARKHGMTIDNLVSVDLVTADGELHTVTEGSDPDLFWALRGGGGNFGIATRFRYRLHPVAMVTGGALFLPLTAQVLRDLVDVSMEAPDELTQITTVMGLPPAPFVPAELVGTPAVIVMPVHAGDPEAGAAAMAPLRAVATPIIDLVGPMPYIGMYQLTAGAAESGPEVVRSAFLGRLDATAADAIVERHTSPAGAAAMTQLRVLGGAMGRVPVGATAFAHREAPLLATVMSGVPGAPEDAVAFADGLLADLVGPGRPAAGVYANFLGDEDASRLRQAYPGATHERLVAVKRRVDPANVFSGNHNIRP